MTDEQWSAITQVFCLMHIITIMPKLILQWKDIIINHADDLKTLMKICSLMQKML